MNDAKASLYTQWEEEFLTQTSSGERVKPLNPLSAPQSPQTPERALLRAVLRDAIMCLAGEGVAAAEKAKAMSEARAWIMSKSRAWLFAFESVCDVLGLDAGALRRRLLAAPEPADQGRQSGTSIRSRMRWLRMRGNQTRAEIHRTGVRARRRGGNRVAAPISARPEEDSLEEARQ